MIFPLRVFSVYRIDNSASRSSWACKSKLTRKITVWRRVKNWCSNTMSKYWRSGIRGQQVGSRTDSVTHIRAHSRVLCYLSELGNLSIKTCQIIPNESELLPLVLLQCCDVKINFESNYVSTYEEDLTLFSFLFFSSVDKVCSHAV